MALYSQDKSPDEAPSSPIRIDSRNSRYGRYIMVTQSGAQAPRPEESEQDRKPREQQQDNWKPHEKEEFARWQREEAKIADDRESREQEEKAWRYHLERQRREQEDYGNREKQERERQERERYEREQLERAERERRERDRQALERIERERAERERAERERAERERAERAEREREEREHDEEERIMNQLQKEELEEQREREDHLKQLEEEQVQLRNMEQVRLSRLSSGKGSKEYLDTIESLTADEVEREFQRRLDEERKKKESGGDGEVNSHYALSRFLNGRISASIDGNTYVKISDYHHGDITETRPLTPSKTCIKSVKRFLPRETLVKCPKAVFFSFFNYKRPI